MTYQLFLKALFRILDLLKVVETNEIIPQMVVWRWFTKGRKLLKSLQKNITSGKFHPNILAKEQPRLKKLQQNLKEPAGPRNYLKGFFLPHLFVGMWIIFFPCNLIASIKFVAWIGRFYLGGVNKYDLDRKPPRSPSNIHDQDDMIGSGSSKLHGCRIRSGGIDLKYTKQPQATWIYQLVLDRWVHSGSTGFQPERDFKPGTFWEDLRYRHPYTIYRYQL